MHTVQRSGLIAQVTEQIRTEIQRGAWPVGSRIPSEPDLAELTGTGRNTVREAVQALVHTGMLERRQGSGTYVLATSDLIGSMSRRLSSARNREVLELRLALEVTAAALAAVRRTDTDIARLIELRGERDRQWASGDPADAVQADVALHRAVVAAAGNDLYLEVYDSLATDIARSVDTNAAEHERDWLDEHAELVDAVIAGDSERASRAARQFLTALLRHHDSPLRGD